MFYLHQYLYLNNRKISLQKILENNIRPNSPFEEATTTFLQQWFNNQQTFQLQTSGSTGTPKKIEVTKQQLEASALATLKALRLQSKATALICLPTQYIAGIMMLVRCLVGNLEMHIIEPSANPLRETKKKDFDFAALVPYQIDAALQHGGIANIEQIKTIIIGGAPLGASLKEKLITAHSNIYLTYGMTETLSHIALQKISGNDASEVFTILPGVEISTDERQCLLIKVPYLTELVVTNDIVELINNSSFKWLGRWDHVINSGGIKLHPEKIENTIQPILENLYPGKAFFIAGIPDEKLGTKAVLIIENVNPISKDEVINALRKHLKSIEIPKEIVTLPQFNRTPTGKIQRKETLLQLGL